MMAMHKRSVVLVVALVLAASSAAWGLINPRFTPIHLENQCDLILSLKLKNKDMTDKAEFEIVTALKGTAPKSLTLDLSQTSKETAAFARKQLVQNAAQPALFFSGKAEDKVAAFMHVRGLWLKLEGGKDNAWSLADVDLRDMPQTWAGGTDMLTRCIQYIIADPGSAAVPSTPGTNWRQIKKVGSIQGKVGDMSAVDLACDGKLSLFVASDKGDRLLKPAKDGFEDVTAKLKLGSSSTLAAWGDFGGDGRMSLASFDGKTLTLWVQSADGTFTASKPAGDLKIPADCVGMAVIGVGAATPGLLLSPVAGSPVLLKPAGAGKSAFETVALPALADAKDNKMAACLVADLNGDGLVDMLQPGEKGGALFLGNKAGGFDAPKACGVYFFPGIGKAVLADLDADGLLDVVVADGKGVRVYQNLGNGGFEESVGLCGEMVKVQPGASWCGMGDFNNDARPDLFVTYVEQPLQMFFNRGFRSFGESPDLEPMKTDKEEVTDLARGQQAGVLADFGNVGAQDFVIVLNNGEIWCGANGLAEESYASASGGSFSASPRCVRARLPAKSTVVGPVIVSVWKDKRCMGTTTVSVGGAPAFFGIADAGKYTLKWTLPGGKETTKAVTVIDKPVNVVMEEPK